MGFGKFERFLKCISFFQIWSQERRVWRQGRHWLEVTAVHPEYAEEAQIAADVTYHHVHWLGRGIFGSGFYQGKKLEFEGPRMIYFKGI